MSGRARAAVCVLGALALAACGGSAQPAPERAVAPEPTPPAAPPPAPMVQAPPEPDLPRHHGNAESPGEHLVPPSAHAPPEQRWMPARGSGGRCRVRTWADAAARTAAPRQPESDVEYTFDAQNRLTKIAHLDNPAAHTSTETRRIDRSTGRAVSAVLTIHESAEGPIRHRLRFTYEVGAEARVASPGLPVASVRQTITGALEADDVTLYEYDDLGRPLSMESSLRGMTSCIYGPEWPSEASIDGVGQTSYLYDAEHRLLGWGMIELPASVESDRMRGSRVARESESVVVVTELDDAGAPNGAVTAYEGNCADVIYMPCSRAFAPAPPEAPAP